MHTFDIVLSAHNSAAWIREAIESVFRQTRRDCTLTVVDDGSSDATRAVAERVLARGPEEIVRRVIHTPDVGPSAARHAAIAAGTAPYVMYFDADDKLEPTALERLAEPLQHEPTVGFTYSDRRIFGEVNGLSRSLPFDFERLKIENAFAAGGALIRRAAYEDVGGFRPDNWGYLEDWSLWLDIAQRGWLGQHVPEPLFCYRHNVGESLSFFVIRFREAYQAWTYCAHPDLYAPERVEAAGHILAEMPPRWHTRPPFRSVADCEAGLAASPGNRHLLFLLAMALVRAGATEAARARLLELRALDPADVHAELALLALAAPQSNASVRLGHRRVPLAEALCLVLLLRHAGILVDVPGTLRAAAKRIRPRSVHLEAILLRLEEERIARMRRRWVTKALGQPDAVAALAKSAQRSELHMIQNVGARLKAEGVVDEAQRVFQRLLAVTLSAHTRMPVFDSEIASCYFHLGELAMWVGDGPQAIALFKRCLQYIPNHKAASGHLRRMTSASA